MINFWVTTIRLLHSAVISTLTIFGVCFVEMNIIKFDITENNIDHAQFLNDYKIYGPPALMFFDNDGKEIESARIVGFIDADKFLIKLNQLNID